MSDLRVPDSVSTAALRLMAAYCGTAFRALAALWWASNSLGHKRVSTAVTNARTREVETAHSLDVPDESPRDYAAPYSYRVNDPTRQRCREVLER